MLTLESFICNVCTTYNTKRNIVKSFYTKIIILIKTDYPSLKNKVKVKLLYKS